jgi:hypothetical protein
LTTAACSGLRPEPDCRPRRTYLHLSYSYVSPFGPAILVTHDPERPIREAGMNHGLSFVGESAADFGSVELSSRFQSLSELEFLTRAAFPTSKGTIAV